MVTTQGLLSVLFRLILDLDLTRALMFMMTILEENLKMKEGQNL